MDIHKPKAAHSWREFLIEIGTIICGILIALGLEQAIEQIHWRHVAEAHQRDLDSGATWNMTEAAERLALADCHKAELKRLAAALRASNGRWKGLNPDADAPPWMALGPRLWLPSAPWAHAAWAAAAGDGSLTHLPQERVRLYAFVDYSAVYADELQRQGHELVAELAPLGFDQTLSPADKARYLAAVAKLTYAEWELASVSRAIIWYTGYWGRLRPDPGDVRMNMDGLRAHLPADCVRDVDIEAIARVKPPFTPR